MIDGSGGEKNCRQRPQLLIGCNGDSRVKVNGITGIDAAKTGTCHARDFQRLDAALYHCVSHSD